MDMEIDTAMITEDATVVAEVIAHTNIVPT